MSPEMRALLVTMKQDDILLVCLLGGFAVLCVIVLLTYTRDL